MTERWHAAGVDPHPGAHRPVGAVGRDTPFGGHVLVGERHRDTVRILSDSDDLLSESEIDQPGGAHCVQERLLHPVLRHRHGDRRRCIEHHDEALVLHLGEVDLAQLLAGERRGPHDAGVVGRQAPLEDVVDDAPQPEQLDRPGVDHVSSRMVVDAGMTFEHRRSDSETSEFERSGQPDGAPTDDGNWGVGSSGHHGATSSASGTPLRYFASSSSGSNVTPIGLSLNEPDRNHSCRSASDSKTSICSSTWLPSGSW